MEEQNTLVLLQQIVLQAISFQDNFTTMEHLTDKGTPPNTTKYIVSYASLKTDKRMVN